MAVITRGGNEVAMEEMVINHEGLKPDGAEPAAVDGADFLAWQRNHGGRGQQAAGDADADGDVDGSDYLLWRSGGGAGEPHRLSGDFNGDGDVDAADYLVSPRDPASGQATGIFSEDGPSVLLDLRSETTVEMPVAVGIGDVPELDFEFDL